MKGKAKIDFEQWYDNEFNGYEYLSHRIKRIKLRFHFWDMPNCFQQGVLLQFFRERGIDVVIGFAYEFTEKPQYFYQISNGVERKSDCKMHPDYSTAFTHAIDKACEIYGGEG